MPIATRKRSRAVIAIAVTVLAPVAIAQEEPALFRSVQMEAPPESGEYEAAYHVELDHEAIRQPAQRLRLNLPDREPEWIELHFWSPRAGYIQKFNPDDPDNPITIPDPSAAPEDFAWRWYGHGGNYTVALTVHKGRVAGRISGPGHERYALEPRTLDSTRLGRVTPGYWRLHPEHAPRAALPAPYGLQTSAVLDDGWIKACRGEPPGGIHVIDVLVLYTQGIFQRHFFNHDAVVMKMAEVLDDANQSLRNSGIQNVTFSMRGPELVPSPGAGVNYDQDAIEEVLLNLSGIQDIPVFPYLNFPGNTAVASLRDAMWADIVAMARDDQSGENSCGYSWIQNQVTGGSNYYREPGQDWGEKFAYMVFDPACNADSLNFAHELGHQLGLEHDPRNSETTVTNDIDPACPWAYAHRRSNVPERFRFRTVMSYWEPGPYGGSNQTCGPGTGDPDLCPLIDAFSNPDLEWAGFAAGGGLPPFGIQPLGTVAGAVPIGVATWSSQQNRANASDVIRRVAPISAAFRARPEAIFSHGFE